MGDLSYYQAYHDWHRNTSSPFPPGFTSDTVRELPRVNNDTGTVEWADRTYENLDQWNEQIRDWDTVAI